MLTMNWAANKNTLRTSTLRGVNFERAIPQPAIVTNNGAANPPNPEMLIASIPVREIVLGVQVATA